MNPFGIFIAAPFKCIGRIFQSSIRTRLFGFTIRVVEFIGKQRFEFVSLFNRLLDFFAKVFDFFLTFLDSVNELLAFVIAAEPIVFVLSLFLVFQLFRKFFLFILQILSPIAHFPHLFIELASGLFLEFVAKFF